MRGIRQSIRKKDWSNRLLAERGCIEVERLVQHIDGPKLQAFQEFLWSELEAIEHAQRKWKARDKRRRALWGKLSPGERERAEARRIHIEQVERRSTVLDERRRTLHQLGDACAWLVLRCQSRVISPLFASNRNHMMPGDWGAYGAFQVLRQANESGFFLAIDTDLTRCLGVGDIVIVPSDGIWIKPLAYEVKTHKREEGLEIVLVGPKPQDVFDVRNLAEFSARTGFKTVGDQPLNPRGRRQAEELQARFKRMTESFGWTRKSLERKHERHWSAVEAAISAAQTRGMHFQRVEDGIVYAAVRNRPGDDPNAAAEVIRRVTESGLIEPAKSTVFSTLDLRYENRMSPYALPLALWNVPLDQRIELLHDTIYLISFVEKDVWANAFRRHGLEFLEEGLCWRLSRGDHHHAFDPPGVKQLMFDVPFSAASPDAFAAQVAEDLDRAAGTSSSP